MRALGCKVAARASFYKAIICYHLINATISKEATMRERITKIAVAAGIAIATIGGGLMLPLLGRKQNILEKPLPLRELENSALHILQEMGQISGLKPSYASDLWPRIDPTTVILRMLYPGDPGRTAKWQRKQGVFNMFLDPLDKASRG